MDNNQQFHRLTTMYVTSMKLTKGSVQGNQRTPGVKWLRSSLATVK